MSLRQMSTGDEWQLGPEPGTQEHVQLTAREPKPDLSRARLERPVHVVTVEHLAWAAIAVWAVVTRFVTLGGCPLTASEARHALFEYDLVNATRYAAAAGYHPAWSGWIHLVEAGCFALGGTSDMGARLVFVISGLVMVGLAFALRRNIGRAGAIALAAFIAISPSFTWFSRTSATGMAAAMMAMIAVDTFLRVRQRPTVAGAIALGCVGGLMAAADPAGLIVILIFMAALAILGLYELAFTANAILRARVWFERYGDLPLICIAAAVVLCAGSELILFRPAIVGHAAEMIWRQSGFRDFAAGLRFYAPGLVLYEFLILAVALAGVVGLTLMRAWSREAVFFVLWTVISAGYFISSSEREPDRIIQMLLPATLVGAIAVECVHRTRAWRFVRVPLLLLVLFTVYVQVLSNLVYNSPDSSEAPWARHANLYWGGATTVQARQRLNAIRGQFPATGGTVFNSAVWPPSLRWYLRDFRPANDARFAGVIVNRGATGESESRSRFESTYIFDLEESWVPTLGSADPTSALRFLVSAIAWQPLDSRRVSLTVHPPGDLAPTMIMPPPGQS